MDRKCEWTNEHIKFTLKHIEFSLEKFKTVRFDMNNGNHISMSDFEKMLRSMIMVKAIGHGLNLKKCVLLSDKAEKILFAILKKDLFLEEEIFDAMFWTFLKVRILLKQVLNESKEKDDVLSELHFIHGALAFKHNNEKTKTFSPNTLEKAEEELEKFHLEVLKTLKDFE